jgi:hypothetical protein
VSGRMWVAAALATATMASAGVALAGVGPAQASPGVGVASVVSLGDSFVAGEGGRLAGNAENPATDRGFGVYGNTVNWLPAGSPIPVAGGCHRSDSAPIMGVSSADFLRFNLACSGAGTANVWRSDHGGQSFKSEPPQADALDAIARTTDVKAVVLSVGGNDLGFADIVSNCVWQYVNALAPCRDTWDSQSRSAMPTVMANVRHAIDDIRTTMSLAGYHNSDYRLIVESYPTPIADKANLRGNNSGCPIYGDDADWVNHVLVPRLAGAIRQVVRDADTGSFSNAQFLDLSGAFNGHELCNKNAQYSTTAQPAREVAEWANWININITDTNRKNESGHPNFWGQVALGNCLRQMLLAPSVGNFRCTNDAGAGQVGLGLHPLGTIWSSYAPAQVLTAGQAMSPGTCVYAATGSGALCYQTDGNLVNYRGSTAVWASGTQLTGGFAILQNDGNLVVYTSGGQARWASDTGGNPDDELVVQDSGYIALLNPGGTAIWPPVISGGGGGGGSGGSGGGPGGPPRQEN